MTEPMVDWKLECTTLLNKLLKIHIMCGLYIICFKVITYTNVNIYYGTVITQNERAMTFFWYHDLHATRVFQALPVLTLGVLAVGPNKTEYLTTYN